jgi:hypothetical protein
MGRSRRGGAGSGAHVGERFAVGGHLGALLLDAPFATASDWAFAERVDGQVGWRSHSPVTRSFQDAEPYRMLQMQESTPDFSTVMWSSNAGDLPFFEEMAALGAANNLSSLISDWGSPPESPTRWEPIGPLAPSQRIGSISERVFLAPAISADGSHIAVSGQVRGLAGVGDPTLDTVGDAAQVAYIDDVSAGLSDSWPGAGIRVPAAACTGQDGGSGQSRTRIPVRNVDGSLGEVACAASAANRDSRLVSDLGSAFSWQGSNASTVGTSTTNVISADGSRAFFMAPDPKVTDSGSGCVDSGAGTRCPTQLYVRQRNVDGEVVTRWVSRPEAGLVDDPLPAGLLGAAYFEGASADGSKVFFRTNSPLTADDPNGAGQDPANPNPETERGEFSWDLYMFELAPGPDGNPSTPDGDPTGPGSELTRITAGPSGAADCGTQPDSAPANALRFSSQDASRVYFSCSAPLGGVADRSTGTAAGVQGGSATTADLTNVYLYDTNAADPADRYRFVARIPRTTGAGGSSNENLTRCASVAGLRGAGVLNSPKAFKGSPVNCWRGSEDGGFATFWTLGRLTGDDPDEFGPGASADIYAYDVDSDELLRISTPQGAVDETYPCGSVAAGTECYADPGMHSPTIDPTAPNPLLNIAVNPVSGERAVFFESESRLVDEDENAVFDVYQWRDGVLSLVSGGDPGSDGVTYKGNSVDGLNVYLATRDRLTWQDVDAVLDVYTARVGGGIAQPSDPPVCVVLVDGCHPDGGGAAIELGLVSDKPAGVEAAPRARPRLAIAVGARARRRAARTGVLAVRVRASGPGVVRLVARARIAGKPVKVASARKRMRKAGTVVVRLRLNRQARRVLSRGSVLGVSLRAAQPGTRVRTATVRLERGNRR